MVLLGLLLPWRCFPLLLRGAAWFLPSLGGVAVLLLLFGGVALGGAAFSHVFCWVVLLGLLSLLGVVFLFFVRFASSFLPSVWVVLLFFLLLLVGCSFITSLFLL